VVIFLGPTLSRSQAKAILEAAYWPPAERGDILKVLEMKPSIIGLIDGTFQDRPSIGHGEILLALSRGIRVVGAASMGALRAADLHCCGMEGVGAIFRAYRSGLLKSDDEVAILHAPQELGWLPLTEAMVNVRANLRAARRRGILSWSDEVRLLEVAKSIFYEDRTWPRILDDPRALGMGKQRRECFAQWLATSARDQKAIDAIALLKYVIAQHAAPKCQVVSSELPKRTKAWRKFISFYSENSSSQNLHKN
jgi:hypothetical protein